MLKSETTWGRALASLRFMGSHTIECHLSRVNDATRCKVIPSPSPLPWSTTLARRGYVRSPSPPAPSPWLRQPREPPSPRVAVVKSRSFIRSRPPITFVHSLASSNHVRSFALDFFSPRLTERYTRGCVYTVRHWSREASIPVSG